eukprot:scaffold25706_cov17-Tisochrysis_lutea.AAC.1
MNSLSRGTRRRRLAGGISQQCLPDSGEDANIMKFAHHNHGTTLSLWFMIKTTKLPTSHGG